ncbi:hypothetical protein [Actinoplanes sp. DH11]|uniref:hypothetical protein n=1 Tax=Actinoplanes sp. DH11 TaxID=2857011 RepID=UPI001E28D803|nr:hypothetical protein [Actinoplanes sp. DH11]
MSGRLPNRLRMGENEAAWEAVAQYVERTVEEAPPEQKPDEIRRVSELAAIAPQAAGPALEAAGWELWALGVVGNALRNAFPNAALTQAAGHADVGWDLKMSIDETYDTVYIIFKESVRSLTDLAKTIRPLLKEPNSRVVVAVARRDTLPKSLPANVRLVTMSRDQMNSSRRVRELVHWLTTPLPEPGDDPSMSGNSN